MRADFVANASHELRTPLAALSGFIETLQGQARDDPAARERFPVDHAGAGDAHGAADRRSAVALAHRAQRPSAARQAGRSSRHHPPGGGRLADAGARPRGGGHASTTSADQVDVLGDRDELLRVFENLIENALKYAASGKRVDISLTADSVAERGARRGPRLWPGHRARASAAIDRALLPRRCRRQPGAGRNRAWPRAGQAHPQPPRRAADDRERLTGRGRRSPPIYRSRMGCQAKPELQNWSKSDPPDCSNSLASSSSGPMHLIPAPHFLFCGRGFPYFPRFVKGEGGGAPRGALCRDPTFRWARAWRQRARLSALHLRHLQKRLSDRLISSGPRFLTRHLRL